MFVNEHHAETYVERAPGESANDRNDRAIRRAAAWYAGEGRACYSKEGMPPRVVLVTDDAENRKKAESEGGIHQVVCRSTMSSSIITLAFGRFHQDPFCECLVCAVPSSVRSRTAGLIA